jgi:hypothetical protein
MALARRRRGIPQPAICQQSQSRATPPEMGIYPGHSSTGSTDHKIPQNIFAGRD